MKEKERKEEEKKKEGEDSLSSSTPPSESKDKKSYQRKDTKDGPDASSETMMEIMEAVQINGGKVYREKMDEMRRVVSAKSQKIQLEGGLADMIRRAEEKMKEEDDGRGENGGGGRGCKWGGSGRRGGDYCR